MRIPTKSSSIWELQCSMVSPALDIFHINFNNPFFSLSIWKLWNSCKKYNVLSTGKFIREPVPGAFSGGWLCRHSLFSTCQNPRVYMEIRCSAYIIAYKQFRHSEPLLQGLGTVGTLLEFVFPHASPGPTLSAGLSRDGGQMCGANSVCMVAGPECEPEPMLWHFTSAYVRMLIETVQVRMRIFYRVQTIN